jgi:hypothetical protein
MVIDTVQYFVLLWSNRPAVLTRDRTSTSAVIQSLLRGATYIGLSLSPSPFYPV